MPRIRIIRPTSFKAFVAQVEALQSKAEKTLWFRGCGDTKNGLLPGAYRSRPGQPEKYNGKLESKIITRFRQRSIPFLDRSLSEDDWDTLFLMQHYGIPTRLLDWTENPFVALFFATMDAKVITGKRTVRYNNDVCIWALDPIKWNRQSLSNLGYKGEVLVSGDDESKAYKPAADYTGQYPICIYGSHNSRRIVAQRGVFTVFGTGSCAMERLHAEKPFEEKCLTKIEINRRYIGCIKNSLLRHGITESTIIPDLSGLAREIKREYGF